MFTVDCFLFSLQEDFFITLHGILAEKEEVTELQPVPEAHVPVMKFKFQGISIDLLYASISLLVVPEVSLIKDVLRSFLPTSMFCCIPHLKVLWGHDN